MKCLAPTFFQGYDLNPVETWEKNQGLQNLKFF